MLFTNISINKLIAVLYCKSIRDLKVMIKLEKYSNANKQIRLSERDCNVKNAIKSFNPE